MKTRYYRYKATFYGLKDGIKQFYIEEGYIRAWTKKQAETKFKKDLNEYTLKNELAKIIFIYEGKYENREPINNI